MTISKSIFSIYYWKYGYNYGFIWTIFYIFGALAQFERSLIQERVKAGLEAAKNRGIRGGRPRAISEEKMIAIKKALNEGMSKASICRTFEVKRSTLIDSLSRESI